MDIKLSPGRYIVAVSGGVDSMVLLNLLVKRFNDTCQFVVAHFDHGIRQDASADREFVEDLAAKYELPFEYAEGKLGADASEAVARKARYEFLERMREGHHAKAIITAHHADDLLETAILNLLRGTGRKGLSSLSSSKHILRPLLGVTKADILAYAAANDIAWREDSTNTDTRYARNYIRHYVLPRFSNEKRQELLDIIRRSENINEELDRELLSNLKEQISTGSLSRNYLISLPHAVAKEVVAAWLRACGLREFDRRTIERLVIAAKTARPGAGVDVYGKYAVIVDANKLTLTKR